jgi:two-component system chemotaxis response regulator CheY
VFRNGCLAGVEPGFGLIRRLKVEVDLCERRNGALLLQWFLRWIGGELMKALVVESSNTMKAVLRRILSMRGFEVAEADDGIQALEILRGMGKADLVLVDWALNEIDSLEFVTQWRLESCDNTMIIMLAPAEPGMRRLQRAFIAGADDYLMKPFTSLQIDEKLAEAGFTWHL